MKSGFVDGKLYDFTKYNVEEMQYWNEDLGWVPEEKIQFPDDLAKQSNQELRDRYFG